MKLLLIFAASFLATAQVGGTVDTKLELELDLIQQLQTHALRKMGCYRHTPDQRYLSYQLLPDDCGKPQFEDVGAWVKARRMAVKLFEIEEVKR